MITTAGGNLCYEPAIYNDEDELCFNKKIIMMALLLNLFYTVQTKGSDIKHCILCSYLLKPTANVMIVLLLFALENVFDCVVDRSKSKKSNKKIN
jgi:hypothetical protein